jgi:capsular exopolysaccharide synthesis family protein
MQDEYQKDDYLGGSGAEINVWRALRKRWLPAVVVAASLVTTVFVYTNTRTPVYRSATLILLDAARAIPVVATDVGAYPERRWDRSNEIQILSSQPLVRQALAQLTDAYPTLTIEQVLDGLSIRQVDNSDVLSVSYADTEPERIKAILEALGSTYVNYSLESKRSQATNAIRFIEEQLPQARLALDESANAIRNFRETHSLVDPDTYAIAVAEIRQGLQQQLQNAQIELDQVQQQNQELRRQMAAVGQDADTILQQSVLSQDQTYQNLIGQLQDTEVKLALEQLRFRPDAPTVLTLRDQRNSVLSLLQQQAGRVLGDMASEVDPTVAAGSTATGSTTLLSDSLLNQPIQSDSPSGSIPGSSLSLPSQENSTDLGSIQQSLALQMLQVQTSLATQTAALNSLRQAETEMAQRFEQIPFLQQTYAELQRRNEINSEVVNNFLAKLQDLRISEAQETSPWIVLDPPSLPTQPISPNKRRNLLLGSVAGLLLGIGTALLLEHLDQRVKSLEEAKELTDLPLLGTVPRIESDLFMLDPRTSRRPQDAGRSQMTEAFRSIALSLGYLGSNGQMKVLAFTSAIPAEGKTTVTYQLGLALAELGRKVLIVDADMRRPSLHRLLQEPNAVGLSTAIATERPWREMIHEVIRGRLEVLTSGPLPPNPVALLGSERMTHLLSEWRQIYHYVLVDTPPIVGITDAQSVASQVDGMILVLGLERSDRSTIHRALEILRNSQTALAGMVVNFLSRSHAGYYYHYYSSYYAEENPAVLPSANPAEPPRHRSRSHHPR